MTVPEPDPIIARRLSKLDLDGIEESHHWSTLSTSNADAQEEYEYYYDSPIDHIHAPQPDIFPEQTTSTSKRIRRARPKLSLPTDLPPLESNAYPPDGRTRFDWRQRAKSRSRIGKENQKERKTKRWFSYKDFENRREGPFVKISQGEKFRDELERYERHFIPLLDAEQAEEERLFDARLNEWTFDRLTREGYALDELSGHIGVQPKAAADQGIIHTFSRGKGNNNLPWHRFSTTGTNVVLSRTDPLLNGWKVAGAGVNKYVLGRVWKTTNKTISVLFPGKPEDFEMGSWRIDVGCDDLAYRRQLEAIKSLNLDPFIQDMSGFPLDESDKPDSRVESNLTAEEEALQELLSTRQKKRDQIILRGTALRDKLFRAFQVDYIPLDTNITSLNTTIHKPLNPRQSHEHDMVQDLITMRPSDLDAVPVPDSYSQNDEPAGILARNQLIQSWTRRHRSRQPLSVEGDPDVGLNPSQMRAIAMMLSERLSLVQGPPGTGKTRVIIETIKLVKKHWQIPFPILVTAHTNVAVDNLLSGLREHGIKALRAGNADKVPEELREWTMESVVEKHPIWEEVGKLEEELVMEVELIFGGKKQEGQHHQKAATAASQRIYNLRQKIWGKKRIINREVLLDADVICATCISAASHKLADIDFPMVFLDEASMATEPLSLIPLMKGSSHVAIIGDHKQLPPVIISPEAHAGGLSTSLFERLIHERHVPSIMLDTQYRMHPEISSFPSNAFYSSLLKDGTPASYRPAPETAFLVPVNDEVDPQSQLVDAKGDGQEQETGGRKNMTFLNHGHPESPMMKSIANYGDAEIVCDVIADLLYRNPELKGSEIGIITPYQAQIRLLNTYIQDTTRQIAYKDVLGEERAKEVEQIEIKTVDGFEGREKKVILFSTVRSNSGGWIGFLGDWRRVNVGLTRAKNALIIVGSKKTLSSPRMGIKVSESLPQGGAKVWRDFMNHLEENGMIMDVD